MTIQVLEPLRPDMWVRVCVDKERDVWEAGTILEIDKFRDTAAEDVWKVELCSGAIFRVVASLIVIDEV